MGPGVEDTAGRVSQSRLGLLPPSLEFASITSAQRPPPSAREGGSFGCQAGRQLRLGRTRPLWGLAAPGRGALLEESLGKGKRFSAKLLLLLNIFLSSFLSLALILASLDLPKIAQLQSQIFPCEGGKAEGETQARLPGSAGRPERDVVGGAQVSFFCTAGEGISWSLVLVKAPWADCRGCGRIRGRQRMVLRSPRLAHGSPQDARASLLLLCFLFTCPMSSPALHL